MVGLAVAAASGIVPLEHMGSGNRRNVAAAGWRGLCASL